MKCRDIKSERIKKLLWAIAEHRNLNTLKTVRDRYLFETTRYAIGEIDEKPRRKDYRLSD